MATSPPTFAFEKPVLTIRGKKGVVVVMPRDIRIGCIVSYKEDFRLALRGGTTLLLWDTKLKKGLRLDEVGGGSTAKAIYEEAKRTVLTGDWAACDVSAEESCEKEFSDLPRRVAITLLADGSVSWRKEALTA